MDSVGFSKHGQISTGPMSCQENNYERYERMVSGPRLELGS